MLKNSVTIVTYKDGEILTQTTLYHNLECHHDIAKRIEKLLGAMEAERTHVRSIPNVGPTGVENG